MSWAEPAVPQGYHDVGQPAEVEDPFFRNRRGYCCTNALALSVPSCWRAWLSRLQAPGEGLDPVAVAVAGQPSV